MAEFLWESNLFVFGILCSEEFCLSIVVFQCKRLSVWNLIFRFMRFCPKYLSKLPVSVAERSKASTVFDRSIIGITGSNTARGMDVCLRLSVLFCPV
jgi:hypothetical protein